MDCHFCRNLIWNSSNPSQSSLVLAKLLYDLPSDNTETTSEPSIPDESLFLIGSSDPWYGYFVIYIQTQKFQPDTSGSKQ